MQSKGISLIELLMTVGILIILAGAAMPAIYSFQNESDLNDTVGEIINILRLARSKTLASDGATQWGTYFTTSTSPHQYTLFEGTAYAARVTSSDEVYKLPKSLEFSKIDFQGEDEVVFDKVVGTTNQFGEIFLRLKDTPNKLRRIYIENSGLIQTSISSVSDANRLRDSRHVHIDYSRLISTSTEKLILSFEGGATEEIVIANNMKGGQIYWEEEIEIGGELQMLKIHTHRLNNPDTQFCIHRDRTYNTKALNIDIDGDPDYPAFSPTLIRYEAGGSTVKGNSGSVSSPIWQ